MLWTWVRRHKLLLFGAVAAMLVLPVLTTAVGGAPEMFLAANAPQQGEHLTVLLGIDPGLRGTCEGEAEVEIELSGIIVYPAVFTKVPVGNCQGSASIPYHRFVEDNAQYLVRARFGELESETFVFIEKYVHWVFVRAFPEHEQQRVRVDVALDSVRGKPLSSGIFATGTLVLDVRWERCTDRIPLGLPVPEALDPNRCPAEGDLVFHSEVPIHDRASTHVYIPYESLESEKFEDDRAQNGWYNVTATFHNDAAKGNYNVPMDPTVYQEEPPGNWFEVRW